MRPKIKCCESTTFIIFGPMDQKLSVFKNFRRSLGMACICWSQPTRVDYMCKKRWAQGRTKNLQEKSLGHPHKVGRKPLPTSDAASLFCNFWNIFYLFVWCYDDDREWARHFRRMGVQHSHFLNLAPTLGRVKSSIPHGAWRFFFSKFFLKLE